MIPPRETTEKRPWWREGMVWLIILLPVSAVIAGLSTMYIAAHNADDVVTIPFSKTGMAVESSRGAEERARQLGLTGAARYAGGQLEVRLDGLDVWPDSINLGLIHPTRANLDKTITLTHAGQGRYLASVVLAGEGKRQLTLMPSDQVWRLGGEWRAPFDEEAVLLAGAGQTRAMGQGR